MPTEHLLYGLLIAMLVGLAKTGIPGVGIAAVPFMAMLFGGKSSVGTLLPMLIVADIFAVLFYRRHADWKIIRQLAPWIIIGSICGVIGLYVIPDKNFKPVLGAIVFFMLVLEMCRRKFKWDNMPNHPVLTIGSGVLTGFSTYMGNAAGPIINIYLLCKGFPKEQFIGSVAWLFLLVNLSKIPFFVPLNMITLESLRFDLMVLPGIFAGVFLGKWLLPRINQRFFNSLILVFTLLSSLQLMFNFMRFLQAGP